MIGMVQKAKSKYVGFWKSHESPNLPLPIENSCTYTEDEINTFIGKLFQLIQLSIKNGTYCAYMGYSQCRICKSDIGNEEYFIDSKNFRVKGFIIPEGYIHYIETHKIQPDKDLFDFINM